MDLRACWVSALVLAAVGCAHVPVEESELGTTTDETGPVLRASTPDRFAVRGQGNAWSLEVTQAEIVGVQPFIELHRDEEGLRGRVLGGPLSAAILPNGADGVYRSAPLVVRFLRIGDVLHVTALIDGVPSRFRISPRLLAGAFGRCGWDLSWDVDSYRGWVGCGDDVHPVAVDLPEAMARWSDPEVATVVGVLLGASGSPRVGRDLSDNSAEYRGGPVPDPVTGFARPPPGSPSMLARPPAAQSGMVRFMRGTIGTGSHH